MPRFQHNGKYGRNRDRKYGNSKRRKVPRKAKIFSRKGSSSQAKQIYTLSKTVKSLDEKMKEQYCHNYYCLSGNTNVGQNADCSPLIAPNTWSTTFQNTNLMRNAEMCYITGMKVRCWCQIENVGDHQVISCMAAIISLKEPRSDQTYHRTSNMNGNKFAGSGATNGEFVYTTNIGELEGRALWKINPELFEIHSYKRFKVGNVAQTAAVEPVFVTNIADSNHEFVLDAKVGRMKLQQGYGPRDSVTGWKSLTSATGIEKHKQRYLLLMTNAKEANTVAWRWQMDVKVSTLVQ